MASRLAPPTSFSLSDFSFCVTSTSAGVQGGHGLVVPALHKQSGVSYAVKIIDLARFNTSEAAYDAAQAQFAYDVTLARATAEASFGVSLAHTFIVPTLGHFVDGSHMYIVMKQLFGHVLVSSGTGSYNDLMTTQEVLAQGAFALEYMHAQHVSHGDIKPENILVAPSGHLALCDFGLARKCIAGGGELEPVGEFPMQVRADFDLYIRTTLSAPRMFQAPCCTCRLSFM